MIGLLGQIEINISEKVAINILERFPRWIGIVWNIRSLHYSSSCTNLIIDSNHIPTIYSFLANAAFEFVEVLQSKQ